MSLFPLCELCHFWPQIMWKCIDSGYLVSATPYTISCLSLCNFAHLFFHGLKMCMWFGFNPAVNFCHFSTLLTLSVFAGATSTSPKFYLFFHFVNFVIFWPQILWKSRDSGYVVSATPHTILYRSLWNFAHVFAMVWGCARGLDIILGESIMSVFSTLSSLGIQKTCQRKAHLKAQASQSPWRVHSPKYSWVLAPPFSGRVLGLHCNRNDVTCQSWMLDSFVV